MERKSAWKVSRILLILLVCAFAALPAAARPNCAGGFHRYAIVPGSWAPDINTAMNRAYLSCLRYWPNPASYSAASAFTQVYLIAADTYYYECWKCSDFPLPVRLIVYDQAVDIARAAYPGVIIGGSTGEIDIDESTSLWVYNIDIQQADVIVRVSVDTQTGEIVAAPPADADAGDQ